MRSSWPVLAIWMFGLPAAAQEPAVAVDLRVVAHATLKNADLDRARETAAALLATGGIRSNWLECSAGACAPAPASPVAVTVLLLPIAKHGRDDICGEATRDGLTRDPTVLVYVPSIADRLRSIHRSAAGRSNPLLSTIQTGHLAGIAIAHEVGHALGLAHAPSGVMKARLDIDDFLAWRRYGLAFGSSEGAAIRAAVMSSVVGNSRVKP